MSAWIGKLAVSEQNESKECQVKHADLIYLQTKHADINVFTISKHKFTKVQVKFVAHITKLVHACKKKKSLTEEPWIISEGFHIKILALGSLALPLSSLHYL